MITYWKIQQRLMKVPGVAWVAIWGERLEMLHVQVDPERLAREMVSLPMYPQIRVEQLAHVVEQVNRWAEPL